MKVKELLNSPENWTKGAYWRSPLVREKNGPDETCQFCLAGAVIYCYKQKDGFHLEKFNAIYRKVSSIVRAETGFECMTSFNDSPKTTFEDVMRIVELADI